MFEILGTVLAGLGLFFVGIRTISDNAKQMATYHSATLQKLVHSVVEGLHAILLTTVDAMESSEELEVDLLISITADRGELTERIRKTYLTSEKELELSDKSTLLYLTNLYERIVWLMRSWATLLKNARALDKVP